MGLARAWHRAALVGALASAAGLVVIAALARQRPLVDDDRGPRSGGGRVLRWSSALNDEDQSSGIMYQPLGPTEEADSDPLCVSLPEFQRYANAKTLARVKCSCPEGQAKQLCDKGTRSQNACCKPAGGAAASSAGASVQPWIPMDGDQRQAAQASGTFAHYPAEPARGPIVSQVPGKSEPLHQRLRRFRHSTAENTGTSIVLFLVHLAITFAVAWALREHGPLGMPHQRIQERDPEVGRMVFQYGLLDEKDCWNDHFLLCVLSWTCPSIQWATTLTSEKVRLMGSFWAALAIAAIGYHELTNVTVGLSHLLYVIIAVYYRQKLREKFGLESGTLETLLQDCFVWCFCCWCAVAQEARQVGFVKTAQAGLAPYGSEAQHRRHEADADSVGDVESPHGQTSSGLHLPVDGDFVLDSSPGGHRAEGRRVVVDDADSGY